MTKDNQQEITPEISRSESEENERQKDLTIVDERQITPEYSQEQIEDILHGDLWYASKWGKVLVRDKLRQVVAQLNKAYLDKCAEVEYTYKPCFDKIVGYVQSHSSKWDVRYLGMSCHDVIIDRYEKLQEENQRLTAIIEQQREAIENIFMRVSYLKIHGVSINGGPISNNDGRPNIVSVSLDDAFFIVNEIGKVAAEALASDHIVDAGKATISKKETIAEKEQPE